MAECTAVGPIVLFVGAVIAYPAALKAKLVGATIGFLTLTAVNVIRIMSLVWVGPIRSTWTWPICSCGSQR